MYQDIASSMVGVCVILTSTTVMSKAMSRSRWLLDLFFVILQLMVAGQSGIHGVHVLSPVVKGYVHVPGDVTHPLPSMAETPVLERYPTPKTVISDHVQVSPETLNLLLS